MKLNVSKIVSRVGTTLVKFKICYQYFSQKIGNITITTGQAVSSIMKATFHNGAWTIQPLKNLLLLGRWTKRLHLTVFSTK
jgi:hypothetical protein